VRPVNGELEGLIQDAKCPHTIEVCRDNQPQQGCPHAKCLPGCDRPPPYDRNVPTITCAAERTARSIENLEKVI